MKLKEVHCGSRPSHTGSTGRNQAPGRQSAGRATRPPQHPLPLAFVGGRLAPESGKSPGKQEPCGEDSRHFAPPAKLRQNAPSRGRAAERGRASGGSGRTSAPGPQSAPSPAPRAPAAGYSGEAPGESARALPAPRDRRDAERRLGAARQDPREPRRTSDPERKGGSPLPSSGGTSGCLSSRERRTDLRGRFPRTACEEAARAALSVTPIAAPPLPEASPSHFL